MARAVTAIYRTHATATLVHDELAGLGVAHGDIHVIPDRGEGFEPGTERDVDSFNSELHGLGIPEDDLRGYQNALRRGDHLVSVEVSDDAHLDRVLEIMRHPEAADLDALDTEYRDAEYVPYAEDGTTTGPGAAPATGAAAPAAGMGAATTGVVDPATGAPADDPARRGRSARDADHTDTRTRTYRRDEN